MNYIPIYNPFLDNLKKEFQLLEENKHYQFLINQNIDLIQTYRKECNHLDEDGKTSFSHKIEAGSGKNLYECTLCSKTISWSVYNKLKNEK
jgi:hypothetical protein